MKKVLVDTSVWIDALNGISNWQTEFLGRLIESNANVVLCPTIVQEILQGIKSDSEFKNVKENLSGFEMLEVDPTKAAHGAAVLYRTSRKQGITIRKSNDRLIAFFAIYCKASLLHNDSDFDKIAEHAPLQILEENSK